MDFDNHTTNETAITGHLDVHRSHIGQHRLEADPVAPVPRVAARRVVAFVAEMLRHLRLETGLQHVLGQPAQQPAGTDKLDPLASGTFHQLFSKLLILPRSFRRLRCFRHCMFLSAEPRRASFSGQQAVTPSFRHSPLRRSRTSRTHSTLRTE